MALTRIMMIATTRRIWINPLTVYDETSPASQSTSRTTAIVYNMVVLLFYLFKLYTSLSFSENSIARDTHVHNGVKTYLPMG